MNGTQRHYTILFALALAVTACEGGKSAPTPADPVSQKQENAGEKKAEEPAEKKPLTVYCGRNEKLIGPVIEAFTKETGIKVTPRYGKTQQLATQLVKEGARTPADVFVAQDASTLAYLDGKGVFGKLDKTTLDAVDAAYHGANNTWVGTTGRARVLVYDPDKVSADELPRSVDDLTGPRWKGKVGWAPENSSFKSFVAAMIQLRGAEATAGWLAKMHANEPKAYPKNTPAVRAVHKGEIEAALVNHYYLFRVADEVGGTRIKNHYFRNGQAEAMVNLTGAGILKTTANRGDAEKFVRFLTGSTAQAHFGNKVREFPIDGSTKTADIPKLKELNAPRLDAGKLGNLEETEKLLRSSKVLP